MKSRCIPLIFLAVVSACTASEEVSKTGQTNPNIASDSKLIELVRVFSEDVGERGDTAFKEIRSRQNAINELVALSRRLHPDDALQPQIAFALLNLGYQYEANVRIITSALSKDPKFKDFDADQAASLLIRLIHKGDKKRLPDLIRSSDWGDGALAEIIGDEVGDQLLHDTAAILTLLTDEPQGLRTKIYGLIQRSGSLSAGDKRLIDSRLQKITMKSPLYKVAQELRSSTALQ